MDEEKNKFVELLRKFKTGMLVTRPNDENFHGRPMALLRVDEDGTVYFNTSTESPKYEEIEKHPQIAVFFQEPHCWISLYGKIEVIRDRTLIHQMWQESWKVWFPEGKNSPELCILRVRPSSGEYWDESGMRRAEFLFESVKAYINGTQPNRGAGNAKVAMGERAH